MTRSRRYRISAGILLFVLIACCLAMASDTEKTKKKKQAAEAKTAAVSEQLQHMQEQLDQQQSQIKAQQDQIQGLEQQLQQSNSQLGQQSNQTRQLQDEVRQADQKATGAEQSATSASAGVVEAKTETASVSKSLQESQKTLDKIVNPEKYIELPKVVAAIAPLRPLPVDPPKRDGLVPAFRIGAIRVTPYGFIKATAMYDSSSPNGDDFPFVGLFLTAAPGQVLNAGPNGSPEFHVKARSTRLGTNFEWPDMSKHFTLTGRVEMDFEGNFSEVDNRDVSSIRSNSPQLRLAWARLDYKASDKTDFFFKGGQDWTLFGSTVLPNILETTFLGAFYGTIYTRSPQMTVGFVQGFGGGVKFMPEFGIMMPSSGQILKLGSVGLAGQLGEGEREGADAGRPEYVGRAVLQFPVDHAKGVAPAQLIFSGFQGRRQSIVTNTSTVVGGGVEPAAYAAAFPNGFTVSSEMYGGQVALQLPTRFFTLVASAYRGGDLRFYFGGQVNSYATDLSGLTNAVAFTTTDGGPLTAAGMAALATNAAGQVVVAPQKPIRAFGGFVNVGFPLSRWFNANPAGHNAGWQLYFHAGKDEVVDRDLKNTNYAASVNTLSPLPLLMGKVGAVTLYYKLNQWCQFGFEQSIYATRLAGGLDGYVIGTNPNGTPRTSNEWQDHRSEFGPIFTF